MPGHRGLASFQTPTGQLSPNIRKSLGMPSGLVSAPSGYPIHIASGYMGHSKLQPGAVGKWESLRLPLRCKREGRYQDWDRAGRPGSKTPKQTKSQPCLSFPDYRICRNTWPPVLLTALRTEDTNAERLGYLRHRAAVSGARVKAKYLTNSQYAPCHHLSQPPRGRRKFLKQNSWADGSRKCHGVQSRR